MRMWVCRKDLAATGSNFAAHGRAPLTPLMRDMCEEGARAFGDGECCRECQGLRIEQAACGGGCERLVQASIGYSEYLGRLPP